MVRAVAWSPTSQWFVIATESGLLQFLSVDGEEFNRCECGAPIWAMKVVKKSFLGAEDDGHNDDDDEEMAQGIAKNELGVFNT